MTLIQRLQEAGEGSRELSDEVLRACGWDIVIEGHWLRRYVPGGVYSWPLDEAPDPSRSIDDVVALLPEGFDWDRCRNGVATVHDLRPGMPYRGYEGWAATPALALCAAIIRARGDE